jgi:hypothetical protein
MDKPISDGIMKITNFNNYIVILYHMDKQISSGITKINSLQ